MSHGQMDSSDRNGSREVGFRSLRRADGAHVDAGGSERLSIHRGLWGPDTKTDAEGLDRAKRTLVQGCDLGPGQHVLDAGCGVGGTAIFLAETHGVRVTGLTNCGPQVAVAKRFAQERGVAHLVEFKHGDFMEPPFPDATFDVVLNHESLCYAVDKLAYLQGVYRVLKPGGRWQSLDAELANRNGPLSERHEALLAVLEWNWRLPPYRSWRDVLAIVEQAGFTDIEEQDLTKRSAPVDGSDAAALFAAYLPESANQPDKSCFPGSDGWIGLLRPGIVGRPVQVPAHFCNAPDRIVGWAPALEDCVLQHRAPDLAGYARRRLAETDPVPLCPTLHLSGYGS